MDALTIVALAADAWAARFGLPSLTYSRPDEVIRHRQAVDLLARDGHGAVRLALEHTIVESFPAQRTKQIGAIELLKPLEDELSGQLPLPGRYELSLAPGTVMGLKHHARRIRAWTKDWVLATAPQLEIGGPSVAPHHFAEGTVPGAGLKLTLYRWPGRQGRLRLVFDAPLDAEKQLAAVLEKALREKCGKLADAAESPAAESMLLLEVADVALGNVFKLDPLVADRVRLGLSRAPDHIWLVDSTDEPPTALIAKERERLSNEIGNRYFPFGLGESDVGKVGPNDDN